MSSRTAITNRCRWAPRLLAALVPTLLTAACAGSLVTAPGSDPGPPRIASVRPDRALDRAFDAYAHQARAADHWTGGDSTYSVSMPGGELWIFSDTLLGPERSGTSRSPAMGTGPSTPMVHNSFVRWSATGPRTVTGHDRFGQPAAVVPGPDRGHWYWARAGLLDGDEVTVVYARYAHTGSGALAVSWQANVLARFRPGQLSRPESVTPLPSAAGIAWGAWLTTVGSPTYVYGTQPAPSGGNFLYLAQVRGTDLRAPWRYWTASGLWSARESQAARLDGADGSPVRTSTELSVVRHGDRYALLTQPEEQPFSSAIQLAWSGSPAGPFTAARTVFTAPEAGATGTFHNRNVSAYNPHEHPELEGRNELVVSYNVNSLDPGDVLRTASIYRPRFIRIRLTP